MKICIVSPFAVGVNISPRLYQAALMAKRGHEMFFITPRQQYSVKSAQKDSKPSLLKNYNSVEMRFFNVIYPLPKLAYPLPNLIDEMRIINRIIKKNDIDMIHIYQPEFLTSLPLPMIKKKYQKPILLTVNGFPGMNWFYGKKIIDFCGLTYTCTLIKFLFRYTDKILLYNNLLRRYAKKLGVSEEKMVFLPEGINFDTHKYNNELLMKIRMNLRISSDEKLIIFTGRLVPVKGIDTLIEAFKKLHIEYPNCKLLIVGDGPYRELYEMQAGRLLNKNIFFTGMVEPEKVVHLLLSSNIFVMPSISEGIPVSLLEASSCGLPCIATSVGAVPDIIKPRKTGIIFRVGDTNQLFKSLVYLLNNESAAKKMGKQAKKRVMNLFNWDKIINKYEHICLEQLIKKN